MVCRAQGDGMDAIACKSKEAPSTSAPTASAVAALFAAFHSASAAEQPVHDPTDSTAQPGVSSAGETSSPSARLPLTLPSPSAPEEALRSQPSSTPADVVDLTADDVHSVQLSKSTGAASTPDSSLSNSQQRNRNRNRHSQVGRVRLPGSSLDSESPSMCRYSISSRPIRRRSGSITRRPVGRADGSHACGPCATNKDRNGGAEAVHPGGDGARPVPCSRIPKTAV